MKWDLDKRHGFFSHAKRYPIYQKQQVEFIEIINTILDTRTVRTVLDVGCGDYRLRKLFDGYIYVGVDLENGFDITGEWDFKSRGLYEMYDLVFTSVVLMGFEQKVADEILEKMYTYSNRYVFIFEEIGTTNEDKYDNDYGKFRGNKIVAHGISRLNSNWIWYLWDKEKR